MISYEVTAEVRQDLRSRYEVYMKDRHIPDVLVTGLFIGAQLLRTDEGPYCVRYRLADRPSLDRYLSTHAQRLRADFTAHFPEGVTISREVLQEIAEWPH